MSAPHYNIGLAPGQTPSQPATPASIDTPGSKIALHDKTPDHVHGYRCSCKPPKKNVWKRPNDYKKHMEEVHPQEPHCIVDTVPSVDRSWVPIPTPSPHHARLPTATAPFIAPNVPSIGRFQDIGGDPPQPPAPNSHLQPGSKRDISQSFNIPNGGRIHPNPPGSANILGTNFLPRSPMPAQPSMSVPTQANLGTTHVRDTLSRDDKRYDANDITVGWDAARKLLEDIEAPRHLSAILSYLQLDEDCWGKVWDVSCPEKQCNRDAILRLFPQLTHLPKRLAVLIWELRVLPGWPHIQMELMNVYQNDERLPPEQRSSIQSLLRSSNVPSLAFSVESTMSMSPPEPSTSSVPRPQAPREGSDLKRNAVYEEGGLGTPAFQDFKHRDPE